MISRRDILLPRINLKSDLYGISPTFSHVGNFGRVRSTATFLGEIDQIQEGGAAFTHMGVDATVRYAKRALGKRVNTTSAYKAGHAQINLELQNRECREDRERGRNTHFPALCSLAATQAQSEIAAA